MNAIRLILSILAAYRVARMLTLEDGPADLFRAARTSIDPLQHTWVGRGITCPLCVGFWVSLVIVIIARPASKREFILTWLGVAGAQTAIQQVIG